MFASTGFKLSVVARGNGSQEALKAVCCLISLLEDPRRAGGGLSFAWHDLKKQEIYDNL